MSYIVKSIKYPKSCNECDEKHLCFDFYYCGVGYQKDGRHLDVDEHCNNKTKHPDCPLIGLPDGITGAVVENYSQKCANKIDLGAETYG